jgi:ATP-dependent DNA helicase RecG
MQQRALFWIPTMALGSIAGGALSILAKRSQTLSAAPGLRIGLVALAMTAIMTGVVIAVARHVFGAGAPHISPMLVFYVGVITVTMSVVAWVLFERQKRVDDASAPAVPLSAPQHPALATRLAQHLRDHPVLALQAEDHYVRVHTPAGSDLVLIRLTDAAAEMAPVTGARTHRSWWVNRSAVQAISRKGTGTVLVLSIAEGVNKPYMDKNGAIWVKNGSDKRRATSREELQRLFQQAGLVHADETPVAGLSAGDLDLPYFEAFFAQQFGEPLAQHDKPLPQLLTNMNLMNQGQLNVAAGLLFAKTPQYALPAFIVKAVAFVGTQIEDERYIDSRDITGKLADVFQQTLGFIVANTRATQGGQGFNSQGLPEIPRIVWEELVANALIHRDYFVSAPVRVLVFADRVEIISPGHLPNNLTIENIKAGNSNMRNPILASFAAKLLPYRGLGSGLLRALRAWPQIELIDDRAGNLFKVIVARPQDDLA